MGNNQIEINFNHNDRQSFQIAHPEDFLIFTFSDKVKDSESGHHYFGARYYDSEALTGWLSVDPMSDKYPHVSPYNYCAGNPVKFVDPEGKEIWINPDPYNSKANRVKWTNNGLYNADGSKYVGDGEFVKQTASALDAIYSDKNSQFLLDFFIGNTQYDIELYESSHTEYHEAKGGVEDKMFLQTTQPISFNPRLGLAQYKPDAEAEEFLAPFVCLLHEFGHAYDAVTNKLFHNRLSMTDNQYGNLEERYVIENYEHPIAERNGMLQRTSHKKDFLELRLIHTSGPLSPIPIKQ